MSYILEKVTSLDKEKIMQDIKNDPEKLKICQHFNIMPEHVDLWAIDRDANSYLYRGPTYKLGPSSDINYSFFYKKVVLD